MANRKASEKRTYIRCPVSFARMIASEAKEHGLSIPEYLKDKIVVPAEPGGGGSTPDTKYFFSKGGGG